VDDGSGLGISSGGGSTPESVAQVDETELAGVCVGIDTRVAACEATVISIRLRVRALNLAVVAQDGALPGAAVGSEPSAIASGGRRETSEIRNGIADISSRSGQCGVDLAALRAAA